MQSLKVKNYTTNKFKTKASINTTKNYNTIVGVLAHKTNIHDSKTLNLVLM